MFTDEEIRQGREWVESIARAASKMELTPVPVADARRAVKAAREELARAEAELRKVCAEWEMDLGVD